MNFYPRLRREPREFNATLFAQLNTATSVSNLESEYLEEENGSAKSTKVASAASAEKLKAAGLETASNKRMRLANINAWTLRYNDESLESKVRLILTYLRTNMRARF